MSAQFEPSASQRCHCWVKDTVGVPVHVPSEAIVSVCSSRAVPVTAGAATLAGGSGATTAVAVDVAIAVPPSFVAVTCARRVWPTSAGVRS